MPIYEYWCHKCAKRFEAVHSVAEYQALTPHPECGEIGEKRIFTANLVCDDLPGYLSPVTEKWVEGRRARREDLARSGCRPYDPGEKEEFLRRRAKEEADLDRSVDSQIDAAVAQMPARKLELLEQEVRAGASLEFTRSTPA